MPETLKPPTPRQERFAAEYLRDPNATQAHTRAGCAVRGAQPSASTLLRQPQIEAAVLAGRQRLVQALEITVERMAMPRLPSPVSTTSSRSRITTGCVSTYRATAATSWSIAR